MNILICNDQKDYLNLIEKKIDECKDDSMDVHIYSFNNSRDLLEDKSRIGYHIAYVEMSMEDFHGIEIAQKILEKSPGCRIIFICDKYIHVHESFEIGAFHYIKRPIETEVFKQVLENAVQDYRDKEVCFVINTHQCKNCIFNTCDIKYIESYYWTLEVVTHTKSFMTDIKKKNEFLKYLLERHFVQVSQSTVVNMDDIDFMTERTVILKTREVFNIGATKRVSAHLRFDNYLREKEKIRYKREMETSENCYL